MGLQNDTLIIIDRMEPIPQRIFKPVLKHPGQVPPDILARIEDLLD